MPKQEQYDDLLKATRALVAIARRMYPKAGDEAIEVVCTAAVQTELTTAEAA